MNGSAFLPEVKISIPVAGGELAFFRYGPEGGKPVLLIHGITSSNRAWQFFAQSLIARGMTPYAVDLRGRGGSGQLPPPFGHASHTRDLVAAMDFLGIDAMDVVGHSSGAFIGVALRGLVQERVTRLTLIDGGIPFYLPTGVSVEQILPIVLGPAMARLAMTFESKQAYRDYWKVQPAFIKGWSPALDEYVDYDLTGAAPHLRSAVNSQAVSDDSSENFRSNPIFHEVLSTLSDEVSLLLAERGLQNEEQPLYPKEFLDIALQEYPKVRVKTIVDTNHYDIVLSAYGAESCVQYLYGDATS